MCLYLYLYLYAGNRTRLLTDFLFIRFVSAFYHYFVQRHDPDFDKSTLPSMNGMTAGQRCAARFCQSSQEEKDQVLKIVPAVADGK